MLSRIFSFFVILFFGLLSIGLIAFILVLDLRRRVKKKELLFKKYLENKKEDKSDILQDFQINIYQNTKDKEFYEPLINYIKSQIEQNVPKEDIVNILLERGWQMDDIEKGFSFVYQTKEDFIKDQKEKISEDVFIRTNKNQEKLSEIEIDLYKENSFVRWLKEDWLLKLGALLLIIGFGWFTTYAF